MLLRKAACALALVSLVTACNDEDALSPSNAALVQFVNASSTGPVTTTNAGAAIGSTLDFGSASSSCVLVPAGSPALAAATRSAPGTSTR